MQAFDRARYANEAVGALVILALALLIGAVLQAEVIRQWLSPPATLKIVLPEQGLFGLSAGAAVEILGTRAGEVRRIVIDPRERFYAEAEIDNSMRVFIRRDSAAFIRKQFGIAGAAYLEITRGTGEPLDWDYAVIEAKADRAPTEDVGELIEDLRQKIMPIIDETSRAVTALANLIEEVRSPEGNLQQVLANLRSITKAAATGEGAVGKLLADEQLASDLQRTVVAANDAMQQATAILAELKQVSKNLSTVSGAVGKQADAIPEILANTDATLASLRTVTRDLGQATPALPALLAQTQQTTLELERLLVQLRSLWLLGGEASPEPDVRLSPLEAQP